MFISNEATQEIAKIASDNELVVICMERSLWTEEKIAQLQAAIKVIIHEEYKNLFS